MIDIRNVDLSRLSLEPEFPDSFLVLDSYCSLRRDIAGLDESAVFAAPTNADDSPDDDFEELVLFYEYEMPTRGWLSEIYLEHQGKKYPLNFVSLTIIGQGIIRRAPYDKKFMTGSGMIILTDVTLDNLIASLKGLIKKGFFARQKSYTSDELMDLYGWSKQ